MRFADLDCVTIDASGTLIRLADPLAALERGLRKHGVERSMKEIETGFRAEMTYYRERALDGRDTESVALIRLECCELFLSTLACDIDPENYLDDFLASYRFEAEAGAIEVLDDLRRRSLPIAIVSNWDCSLAETLEQLGLSERIDLVVTSAEIGAPKPDPRIFRHALEALSARASRSIHIGDEECDRDGAMAAGMHFAWAPLAAAFEGWS
jgi:HAD superfamily hydrolase (TIGR01509 family)